GVRLVPSILSRWQETFGDTLRLELDIGNTRDLVERLQLGTTDVIVSYGDRPPDGSVSFDVGESRSAQVAFKAFDYALNLVLLCRRDGPLLDWRGRDRNREYPAAR